ncbi:TetR/AcrR family transcriptional regulator [Spirosoma foliorum]|uniref:TetR/AcrR family transcriptional regulator n=1 Tax=Spirosoma foliorum TaxID=2710596 RepID=A0A7G5GXB8_9BACT|nr:TetR/AcrR family transcriptional regulator [Spirosoma foliorum]QMW03510.1 TetR/AcrR family transcriptional regulator [Spirosoma foliorum]
MKNELSKAERTRQFIIEKTAPVFNTKGYAGTSLADLTEVTGLTKGSIYGNFENKEEVALACFDYNLSRINQAVVAQIAEATSYYQKLLVYARFYHSFTRSSFLDGGCPILNTATEADDTNNLLKDKAAKAILGWRKRLTDLIKGGIEVGEFRQDVVVDQMALSIIALIEGGIMIAKVTNTPSSLDKVLQTVEMLITHMKVSQESN